MILCLSYKCVEAVGEFQINQCQRLLMIETIQEYNHLFCKGVSLAELCDDHSYLTWKLMV